MAERPRHLSAAHPLPHGAVTFSRIVWLILCLALSAIAVQYLAYAGDAIRFPFGLDYSEGLIWQQALWLGGPKLYGDIANFPFLVCEYPPLYLIVLRGVHALGIGMLAGGRLVSVLCTLTTCTLLGLLVWRHGRSIGAGRNAAIAGVVAALLPLSLLPVISWSVLMRVDMQALALTYGGIFCAYQAFRRPAWLMPALLFFVASAFTKQIYLAAAAAMLPICLIRFPRQTLRAYVIGEIVGVALLGLCDWLTDGRFLRHIIAYTADTTDPILALQKSALWLAAYPLDAALTLVAVFVLWRQVSQATSLHGPSDLMRAIRTDTNVAWLAFLTLYLALTTIMLVTAGKTGASRNYFIEWMCCWCLWLGCLAAHLMREPTRARPLAWILPVLLLLQLWPVAYGTQNLRRGQFSAERRAEWGALLDRVRQIPGPLLSDDMVLTLQAGREVGLEPGVLLELSRMGLWQEQRLVEKLQAHYFGAVITAYGPGDPTFDARYLPATQAALLSAYPRVETYGDYRLRLAQ
jgi:hypothetical protein